MISEGWQARRRTETAATDSAVQPAYLLEFKRRPAHISYGAGELIYSSGSQVIQAYSSAHSCRTELLPSTLPHYCFSLCLFLTSSAPNRSVPAHQPLYQAEFWPNLLPIVACRRPYCPRAEIFMRKLADKKNKKKH